MEKALHVAYPHIKQQILGTIVFPVLKNVRLLYLWDPVAMDFAMLVQDKCFSEQPRMKSCIHLVAVVTSYCLVSRVTTHVTRLVS